MLIRPQSEDGESWPGYLLRVASLNHLSQGSAHFGRLLNVSPVALIASAPSMVLGKLGLAPNQPEAGQFAKQGTGILPLRNSLRAHSARICPQCLEEMTNKHLLATWDRAFQFTCHKHEILLVDRCPQCSRPMSHLRRKLLACDCGASLLGMPRHRSTLDFGALYRALDLHEIYAAPAQTFSASRPEDLAALIFCRRLKVLQAYKTHGLKPKRLGRIEELFVRLEEIMKIHDAFNQWPRNLQSILESHRTAFNASPVPLLICRPLSPPSLLLTIKAAIADWSFHIHRSLKPRRRSPQLIQKSVEEKVGIKYLIESSGCSYDTAQYWLESGRLGPYEVCEQPNGTKRYQIGKDRVQKAIHIARSSSSVKDMAIALGTSSDTVRALVRAEVVHAIPFGRAPYNVRLLPAEVTEFAARILECARFRKNLDGEQVIFSTAIRRFRERPARQLQDFLEAILNGQIQVSKVQRYVVAIDELLIDQNALRKWERAGLR